MRLSLHIASIGPNKLKRLSMCDTSQTGAFLIVAYDTAFPIVMKRKSIAGICATII